VRILTRLFARQTLLQEETTANIPLLVLFNKIDRPDAVGWQEIYNRM
jgi:hypothetical protein